MANITPIRKRKIRIGTRATNLAIRQAEILAGAIINRNLAEKENIEIIKIKSSGDIITSSIGPYDGKSLFTKEIDQALADKKIDIAAHSVKDLESYLLDGIALLGVLKRMDPRDALITNEDIKSIDGLPQDSLVGTSSPRRGAILKSIRRDINIIEFRGNFETRIRKLKNKEVDATLLAMAGIQRLNFSECSILPFETDFMIPAAGQGAIGMVARTDDEEVIEIMKKMAKKVDIQNEQKLRPSVTKDIFYLGANTTEEVDMSKIFGIDRNVITPDNLNLEATFLTAKKIDGDSSNNTGNIQLTLNYKEQ